MKRIITLFLAMVTVFTCSCSFNVFALDDLEENDFTTEDITPFYLYTDEVIPSLSIKSKTATCTSTVMTYDATKIVLTQYLQKKSGTSWTKVDSWTKTVTYSGTSFVNTKSALTSGTYRNRTVVKVYKGTAYETIKVNSATKTI